MAAAGIIVGRGLVGRIGVGGVEAGFIGEAQERGDSLPRRFALTFFAPYVMGGGDGRLFRAPYVGPPFYSEMVGYVGLLSLMLALAALLLRRDARNLFWACAAAVAFVLALGGYAPFGLYELIYYVPVLNLFRVSARHLMEVEFALAVLAGRGLTLLQTARADGRSWRETVTAEELQDAVASRLAGYKRVRHVQFVDEVPRLPSGKALRRTLKEQWLASH